jgi:HK97 family phage major capsid protein
MLQSTPGIDGLVINDLTRVLALGIDKGILSGSGSAGQPTGLANTAGLTTQSNATFTWAMAVQYETDVATANADVATMAYVTTPAIRGSLKGKVKVSGYPIYMIDNDGVTMNGYPLYVTNQQTTGVIHFGDWSQILLGEWGITDVTVDPYSNSAKGTIKVTAFQTVDVGVRQIGAYSQGTSFS